MILLLSGASHVGKTVLAQRLMERLEVPYVSIDHIKMGLIRSGQTKLTPEDDAELVDYLWPILKEMIKTAIENDQNMILEGVYIPFDWADDFDDGYLKHIGHVCLAFHPSYIERNFERIVSHANEIETRLDDGWLTKKRLKDENARFVEGCKENAAHCNLIEIEETYDLDLLLKRSLDVVDFID